MAMEANADALVCTFCWQRAAIGRSRHCASCQDELETALCGTSDTQDSQASTASFASADLFDADDGSNKQLEFARDFLLTHRQWDPVTQGQFSNDMTASSCSSSTEVERLGELLDDLRLGSARDQLHILKELSDPQNFRVEDLLNAGALLAALPFMFDCSSSTSMVHAELAWRIVLRLAESDPQSVSLEGSVFREGLIPMLVQLESDAANSLQRRRYAAQLLARLVLHGVDGVLELQRSNSSDDMLDVLSWERDTSIVRANVQVLRFASCDDPTLQHMLDSKIQQIQSRVECQCNA